MRYIGKPTERQEAPDKVTGQTLYAGDLKLPGMLHAAALRSPYPHARIVRIDTSSALALPGVRAVLTATDLPQRRVGWSIKDQFVLATDRVRFVGERVAVVAAEDEATARRAAGLIRVQYKPLPAVFEIEEAMDPEAFPVHEDTQEYLPQSAKTQGNVYGYVRISTGGDIEEGWSQSDYVFEDTFSTQSVHQGYLENHAVIALVGPDGSATIWTANKSPFPLRQALAQYTGVPEEALRIVVPPIGGAFGGKSGLMDEPLCYCLSLTTGRPVRMVMRRGEEMSSATPRHPSRITIKSGLKKSGELVARQVRVVYNSGAYGGTKPASLVLGGYKMTAGPYRIPHVLIEGYAVYTNNDPCGFCRAPGHPQAVFAVESHMDMLARRLNMDPLAFRLLNVLKDGDKAPTGEKWRDLRGREVLEEAARRGGWHEARPEGTGLGLALAYRPTGGGRSGAVVTIKVDGSVEVLTGHTDSGTGIWTILRQIASEELGVDVEAVQVVPGDTSVAPLDEGSGAQRGMNTAGWAVARASREAVKVLKSRAAQVLECRDEEVLIGKGGCWHVSTPERILPFGKVAAKTSHEGPVIGQAAGEEGSGDTMSFAAHLAKVKVDKDTGEVEVTRFVAVHDIGRAMNPPAAEGQVEGSVVQGMGFALWEDLAKREGRLCCTSIADYHQPTSLDLPELEVWFQEDAPGPTPFGGKGFGEVSTVPVAAAIANALDDAAGIRIRDLPLSPEKVWRAMKQEK